MPTSVSELAAYLNEHPWLFVVNDPTSRPVKSSYIRGDMLHFRGSLSFCHLSAVRFDASGFEVKNFWGDWMRYEYRNSAELNG